MALFSFKGPSACDSTRPRLLFQAIGLLTLISVAFGAILCSSYKASIEAEKLTATTQARIIEVELYNHGLVTYEYTVSGKRYVGKQEAGNFPVGSWHSVVYDPGNPSFCKLGDKPHSGTFTEGLGAAAALFVLFTLCIIIAYGVKLRQLHAASRE